MTGLVFFSEPNCMIPISIQRIPFPLHTIRVFTDATASQRKCVVYPAADDAELLYLMTKGTLNSMFNDIQV